MSEPTSGTLWAGLQADQGVSEPTSRLLYGRVAGCLSSVGTYLFLDLLLLQGSHFFVEIDDEIISKVILLPSAESFKKG